ncbi:MAG: bifunctional nuclease family protein [Candidatus Nanopelagicaceae bacterium]|mgnify:FL=1|jgi:bifunctional DNase/RNase
MIPVEVVGVRIEMPSNQPIVLLKEISGSRYLPIWVGTAEATAIAFSQQGLKPQRPLTHDLLVDILNSEKIRLRSVHLTELRDGIFYSDLVLVNEDGQEQKVSSRPSDAVALAVRVEAPILATNELFEEAGISIPEQGEDEIEKFKEFLDEISPEDFA